MKIVKKHSVLVLSAFLSLSLVFSVCCHWQMESHTTKHLSASAHSVSHHPTHDSNCNCGHQLTKAMAKPLVKSVGLTLGQWTGFPAQPVIKNVEKTLMPDSFFLSTTFSTGPPIYLLNRVFRN